MKLFAALLALFVMIAAPSLAHAPRPGPNGGLLVDAGTTYHVELVADGSETVALYLFDAADKPVESAGVKANAILIVSGKPARFALEPAGGQKMLGKAPGPVEPGVKGAVQIVLADGTAIQAKF